MERNSYRRAGRRLHLGNCLPYCAGSPTRSKMRQQSLHQERFRYSERQILTLDSTDDLVYVPQEYVSEVQLLNPGDIVIAASSGSRHVVGKAAALTVPWVGSFGAFCYGLRPYLQETASYISLFLQTSTYRDYVSALSAGVNINNLRREHIEGVPLPVAPLNEQCRIVAKIEELFSELDKGVESLKTARTQLKVYRQALLKHAFEGKLTAQWREENKDKLEKPEQLLARIKQEREARYEQQLQEWKAAVKNGMQKGGQERSHRNLRNWPNPLSR